MKMGRPRASDRKYHVVYETLCTVTNKFYIGLHSTDNLDDGYIGSGTVLWRSIKKYGRSAHTTRILETFPTREAAALREEQILTKDLRALPECLNCGPGGLGKANRPQETKSRVLKEQLLAAEIAQLTLTREQILNILLLPNGGVKKAATQHLLRRQRNVPPNPAKSGMLNRRERLCAAKWAFIEGAIRNPAFGENVVELINAYVYNLVDRPVCETCAGTVSFYRYGAPYARFCSTRCFMLNDGTVNPVLSRWKKRDGSGSSA